MTTRRTFFTACSLTLLLAAPPAQANDSPTDAIVNKLRANPALAQGKPFAIIVTFTSKPGMENVTEETLSKITPLTRKEVGNITFDIHRDVDNPRLHYLYERWKNLDALALHLKEPYITQAFAIYGQTLEKELDVRFSTLLDVQGR